MTLKRRHQNSKRAMKARANRAHLAWIRSTWKCVIDNHECTDHIEAAHCRTGTDGGMGLKPGDEHTIPLCDFHHRWHHDKGINRFEAWYGISMKAEAEKYAARSPHLQKLEREEA